MTKTFSGAIEMAQWITSHVPDALRQEQLMAQAINNKQIGNYRIHYTLQDLILEDDNPILIGWQRFKELSTIVLFFRDDRGFKHRVSIYDGQGVLGLIMCTNVKQMSDKEYKSLPNCID